MANEQRSNISGKGNNLAGYTSIAPAPKSAPGKRDVFKPVKKTTTANPIGRRYLEPIGPKMPGKTRGLTLTTKPKSIPRTFLPVVRPPAVVKPPAKKPTAPANPATRGSTAPTQNSSVSNKPPATRFGTVTGTKTGTRVSGGGGYGGGGTRGSGSLSGQGSGSRTAGTSRMGGTQRNDPVRG